MEEVEQGLILHFGKDKTVQLQRTSDERQVVGEQGYLLGSLSNKWILCIPPGAVDYEQEIAISFYHVTDSVGLDSTEFVTGIIEITPHQLPFLKPVELLLRHDVCIEDNSSKVTVLYHSGERNCETFTSLCQLSSTDEYDSNIGITATLWDDFIHIEASHMCRFGLDCKGESYTKVLASLFAPKCPHPEHFGVRLSLKSPQADDKDVEKMQTQVYRGLVWNNELELNIKCSQQETLQIDVLIPSNAVGWTVNEDSKFQKTIDYNDIKALAFHGLSIATDFWFSKGSSLVDVTDFAPSFNFNGLCCRLYPPTSSAKQCSGSVSLDDRVVNTTAAGTL